VTVGNKSKRWCMAQKKIEKWPTGPSRRVVEEKKKGTQASAATHGGSDEKKKANLQEARCKLDSHRIFGAESTGGRGERGAEEEV